MKNATSPRCRHLRTKMFYVEGPEAPEMDTADTTSTYWCLQRMQAFGPDDAPACPEDCTPTRRCFVPGE